MDKTAKITVGGSLSHADGDQPKPDFSGWATKAGLKCTDGRTIMPDAFKHQDKMRVPLVWQHGHNESTNVLGHAILEHRAEGVYTYGYFNDTATGQNAKTLVKHEDIKFLSIFANKLVEQSKNVMHGMIREVSLVLAGANPGAMIDNIEIAHGDGQVTEIEDEAVIYTGLALAHDDKPASDNKESDDGPSVQDVYDNMSDEQKSVVHFMVGEALVTASKEDKSVEQSDKGSKTVEHASTEKDPTNEKEGTTRMSRNVFESQSGSDKKGEHTLSHDDVKGIVADAIRGGSLKEAVQDYALKHGIENIEVLFPDAKNVLDKPEWDARRMEWVKSVISGTRHSPFSRIKSIVADITLDEARAKGYVKGNFKKEEFFGLTKRVTTPSTIYKKQKLDRDDIIDITDFDVVVWLKGEMRLMLEEELARAILVGDGREVDDEDKIRDPAGTTEGAGIRSILHDHDLYAATVTVNATAQGNDITDAILLEMGLYKGSGSPTFYTTLPVLTRLLLTRDGDGRRLYRTASDLAAELGVKEVVAVEVMETEPDLVGIIVNLQDYTVGADRGGDITMFDDFDIDYNQYKYLLETRVSGALTKIRSALIIKHAASGDTLVAPVAPSFDEETGELIVPSTTGVQYRRSDTNAVVTGTVEQRTITLAEGASLKILATPTSGRYFANNVDDEFSFKRPAAS